MVECSIKIADFYHLSIKPNIMSIKFIRNIQFTKLLKINGRLREFNFRKLGGSDEKFSVDTVDDRGNRIVFYMIKKEDGWKIETLLVPEILTQNAIRLHEIIEEELSQIQ